MSEYLQFLFEYYFNKVTDLFTRRWSRLIPNSFNKWNHIELFYSINKKNSIEIFNPPTMLPLTRSLNLKYEKSFKLISISSNVTLLVIK